MLFAANLPRIDMPVWTVAPFVLMLLGIALLPIVASHFWHSNLRKLLVSVVLSLPVIAYLAYEELVNGVDCLSLLEHALHEYVDFIVLLGSLYVVAGGIVLEGDLKPTAFVNTLILGVGAMLANLIGTTGASMLLIRPLLRINARRTHNRHLPVFFIFTVSNMGGLLTPLGDPPLFLGFLHGVDFFWTLSLWPQWLVANGLVLFVFFLWDSIATWRDGMLPAEFSSGTPLRGRGLVNLVFLAGILIAVILQSKDTADAAATWLRQFFACPDLHLVRPWGSVAMASMGFLSLLTTPRLVRRANDFNWEAILEVAVLFIGIFITMVPPLQILEVHGDELGITEPWQVFWLAGSLSSFLDNAPTYMTFATVAAGGRDFGILMVRKPDMLAALSCGAVFMGAMTYIGNGPNFMVKALAEGAGYKMPSFFGYMVYSCLILLPTFALVTYLFFPP